MAAKKTNKPDKTRYQQIIDLNDEKINVLILGTSGCGKSTLINALLGSEVAQTGVGSAVTDSISVYEDEKIPFRMIDTVGYEYGFLRQNKIKSDLAKFCVEGIKKTELDKLIHMIWFCIDGTTKRIDQKTLEYIRSVTNDWKDVPVIIVFTKSYSELDVSENIGMASEAVRTYNRRHPRRPINVVDIIPVVAKEYLINDTTIVPCRGLDTLVTRTNELTPEAKRLANSTIKEIDIRLKGGAANSIIAASAVAAATVGAITIPMPDAPVLVAIQTGMLKAISKTYGISNDSTANKIIDTTLKVGATTAVGKSLLTALKAIPGLNVAAAVLDASVAGIVTFAAGEVSKTMFEKVYSGELERTSVDYEKEIMELYNRYLPAIMKKAEEFSNSHGGKFTVSDLTKFIFSLISGKK